MVAFVRQASVPTQGNEELELELALLSKTAYCKDIVSKRNIVSLVCKANH